MAPDPRWLEILKARGSQTAAVAIACGLLLWADRTHLVPTLEPWMVQLAVAAMVICGLLALASFATTRFASGAPTSRNGRHCDTPIKTLNADETSFLKRQVEKNQTTTQLH